MFVKRLKKRIFADDYLLLFSFICLRSRPVDSNFVHSLVCELPCWNDMWWDDREERVTWWQEALITIDRIVYFHIFSLSKFKRTADLLSLWSAFIAHAQIQQYVQKFKFYVLSIWSPFHLSSVTIGVPFHLSSCVSILVPIHLSSCVATFVLRVALILAPFSHCYLLLVTITIMFPIVYGSTG